MRKIILIAKREIKSNFVTPLAYVVLSGFMLLSGFFFFGLVQRYNSLLEQSALLPNIQPSINLWIIVPYFRTIQVVILFVVPLLTMRLLSEDRRQGTYELLATSPISPAEIVWGKYLGLVFMLTLQVLLSAVFPLALALQSDPEIPPILIGVFGLWLFAISCGAIGLAVSSFSKSQTLSGFLSLVVLLVLYVIDVQSGYFGGFGMEILHYLSPAEHMEMLLKGVITPRDLTYFLSLMSVGLFVSIRILEAERWR